MLHIIGLGLADERDISVKGLEIVKKAERVYLEAYTAVLLVDQSASLAFSLCERAYVLETGRVVVEGLSAELAGRSEVRSAYLGGGTGGTA